MRKSYKFLAMALAAITMAAPLAGCGGGGTGDGGASSSSQVSVDDSKIQIYAYAVENGLTHQWIKDLAEQYNALPENANSKYQVVGESGSMDATTTLSNRLSAGTTEVNIYFGCQSNLKNMIVENKLIDISDMYEMKVDGANKGTIAQKTHNFEDLQLAWSDLNGEGIYAVPYGTGVSGMVFDYDWFLANGLMKLEVSDKLAVVNEQAGKTVCAVDGNNLTCTVAFGNYKVGQNILTPGRDGKYGTYDDGQADTYEEFNEVLAQALALNYTYGFIYTTKSRNAYLPSPQSAVMMQEMGYENYRTFSTFNGNIVDKDGTSNSYTYATGANVFSDPVVERAYAQAHKFYFDYLCGNVGELNGIPFASDKLIHPASYGNGDFTHTSAQDKFVSAFSAPSSIGYSAFMIEGVWFEQSEARGTIDSLAIYGDNYKFGNREFRFYLYPRTATQVSEKSVMALQDDGSGFITNNVPQKVKEQGPAAVEEYIQECKKFLAFTLKEESLAYYTKQSGIPRPFDYTITENDLKEMSPFQRAAYAICHDTENIQIFRTSILGQVSLIRSYGGLVGSAKLGNSSYGTVYEAFGHSATRTDGKTIQDFTTSMLASFANNYAEAYDKVAMLLK